MSGRPAWPGSKTPGRPEDFHGGPRRGRASFEAGSWHAWSVELRSEGFSDAAQLGVGGLHGDELQFTLWRWIQA